MQNNQSANQNYKIALIIFSIISILGLCFGIYGTIQANQALNLINSSSELEDELSLTDETETFGTPASADSINYVSIDYDDYTKSIVVDSSDYLELYTSPEGQDTAVETDTSELIQYIFDNTNSKLGEYSELDNETWSVMVYSEEGISYINGEGEEPDWLNQIINKATEAANTGTIIEE